MASTDGDWLCRDDGTVLAGGREYTALLSTPCHTRGTMTCLSCHSMHDSPPDDQLKRGHDGPASCVQCHREERFGARLAEHTHHAAGSAGSNCVDCHMPHTTYALFKAIRSHQIASPRIGAGVRDGAPNACNLCHLDRTLAWTQEQLSTWYRQPKVPLTEEQKTVPASLLWSLKGHAAQRLITAWHFGWKPAQAASGIDWSAPYIARLLDDSYGPVRFVAARSLRTLPGFADFKTDFLADASGLRAAKTNVLARWTEARRTKPPAPADPAPANSLDEARIQRLLDEQDPRPVTIQE